MAADLAIDAGQIAEGNFILRYTVEELTHYLTEVTGTAPEVGEGARGEVVSFLVGGPETNACVAQLTEAGRLSLDAVSGEENDSYIVRSVVWDDSDYVVLAGNNDRSTLYAVYHYLERLVHVGFFFDGEHIPSKAVNELPVTHIDIVERSRVLHRSCLHGMRCVPGLKWRVSTYWNMQDWQRFLRYLLKKRWNWTCLGGSWIDWHPEGSEKCESYSSGIYPDEYAIPLDQEILKYGRNRGLRFWTFLRYDSASLKDPDNPSGRFEPSDKRIYNMTKGYWEKHVRTFGHDQWTSVVYMSEDLNLSGINERAVRIAYDLWQQIDPGCMVEIESLRPGEYYTREQVRYFDITVPKEVIVEDSHSGADAQRLEYYGGRRWLFSVVYPWHGAPDSWQLPPQTPNMETVLTAYRDLLSSRPELQETIIGYRWRPESINVCPIWAEWMSEVAWNPETADLGGFCELWAVNRFGAEDAPVMQEAIRIALDTTDNTHAFHHVTPSLYDEPAGFDLAKQETSARKLKRALEMMLSLEKTQADNVLWRNTVVEVFKQRWIRQWHVRYGRLRDTIAETKEDAEAKWPAEPARKLLAESKEFLAMYDQLEQVLARDPRYSFRATLEDAYSAPGMVQSMSSRSNGADWRVHVNGYYRHFSAESIHWLFKHQMSVVLRDMLTQFDVPEDELPPEAENWTEEMILTRDDVWQYRNEPVIPKLKEAVKVIWGA